MLQAGWLRRQLAMPHRSPLSLSLFLLSATCLFVSTDAQSPVYKKNDPVPFFANKVFPSSIPYM